MEHKNTIAESSPTDDITDASSSSSWKTHLPYHLAETAALFADDVAPFPFLTSLKYSPTASNGSQHIQALEQTLGLIDSILQPHDRCLGMMSLTDSLLSSIDLESAGALSSSSDTRPKSFLHDEMYEFNQIFSELVASPQRRFPFRDLGLLATRSLSSPAPSATDAGKEAPSSTVAPVICKAPNESEVLPHGLLCTESAPLGSEGHELTSDVAANTVPSLDKTFQDDENHSPPSSEPVSCSPSHKNEDVLAKLREKDTRTPSLPHRHSEGSYFTSAGLCKAPSSSVNRRLKGFGSLDALKCNNHPEDGGKIYEPMNEDDADSGYMTGDSSVLAMVSAARKLEGVATISRDDLQQRIEQFNLNRQGLVMSVLPDSSVFQGNIRVHMNLYRPIKMSLSSRPSSIYDILIRSDARLPENESSVASFRLPNNTFKAIHITSETTTNVVIKTLLNKFNITDNPKRFALYERIIASQEQKDAKVEPLPLSNTLSSVRRLADDDRPLELCLHWADQSPELLDRCQFVLQENDPGEILWEAFSLPELNNFLLILAKEERSYGEQIRIKYRLLKREMERKLHSLEDERRTKNIS